MEQAIITALFSLLGVIIGGVVTFLSTYWLARIQKNEEKKAITSAILSEIAVTLELIEARDYIPEMKRILERIESNEISGSTYEVHVPDDHSLIYKQNASKIGLLPDEFRDRVVKFHQFLEGVICDVKPGGHMSTSQAGKEEFEELIAISEKMVAIGEELKANQSELDNA
jgi:hypothetical protein